MPTGPSIGQAGVAVVVQNIPGPQGPQGILGATGPVGPQGPPGPAGGTGSAVNALFFQGVPISATGPTQSEVFVYDVASGIYNIRQLSEDDILPAFNILSFFGGSTVEIGATVTNPVFTASYTSTPNSATITNTDGIDSPLSLISPFTSGTVVGAFSHNAQATVTFTLTAVKSTTKTASSLINFYARSFAGVGAAGATGATASGNNANLTGASGTLSNEGLAASIVGQSYGPFSPSSQKIYVLTFHTGSPHTFKDQNGFGFAMNAPTTFSFTNQNGIALSYDLYESTNLLVTSFTVTVVS